MLDVQIISVFGVVQIRCQQLLDVNTQSVIYFGEIAHHIFSYKLRYLYLRRHMIF